MRTIDRDEIARLAGCTNVPVITIAEDGERYLAIVRCVRPRVPRAEILREAQVSWSTGPRYQCPPSCGL